MPKPSPRKSSQNGSVPSLGGGIATTILGTQPARLKSFAFELRPAPGEKQVTVAIAMFELLNAKGEVCGQMTFLTDSDEVVTELDLRDGYMLTLAKQSSVKVPA